MGTAEEKILGYLENHDEISDSGKFAQEQGLDHNEIVNVIMSLHGFRFVDDAQKKLDPAVFKIGCSQAGKNKWVEMGKQVSRKVQHVEDRVKEILLQIQDKKMAAEDDIKSLKMRKLIALEGDWKELEFKEYNFNAQGPPAECDHLHPLNKVKGQVKDVFCLMSFEEMPTNRYVESSFWNFDALFQPQQHPARDSHDTFFLKVPSTTKQLPEDYVEIVKHIHESGGYGSRGYGYDWKRDEANKNLLQTHTTAISSQMLYALAQQAQEQPFTPKRYCSIDPVFRNEAVDHTHLAEFHQIEGLICDRRLTLSHLIGVLEDFFSRLGNVYLYPFNVNYHDGLKKWVEIGNSGMFRPEMLRPMGFPEDVTVIAWGLSLERPTMILYGIDNIRDLFGPKVDLNLIKKNPSCLIAIR